MFAQARYVQTLSDLRPPERDRLETVREVVHVAIVAARRHRRGARRELVRAVVPVVVGRRRLAAGGGIIFMCPCVFHWRISTQNKHLGGMKMTLPPAAVGASTAPPRKPAFCDIAAYLEARVLDRG
jgi:hypothetical protein